MERYLSDYIERMTPFFKGIPPATAHEIASAFLAFKYGLYPNAIHESAHAISLIPDAGTTAALKKALAIVHANATDLDNAQVTADTTIAFSDDDRPFLPISLPPEKIEDPGSYTLDNALVLIYAVSLITSPDDEEALAEHRKFIVRLLTGYKKAMGLD